MIYNQRDKIAYFHVWNTFYSNTENPDEIVLNLIKKLDIKKLIIDCTTENTLLEGGYNSKATKELNFHVQANNIEAILALGSFPSKNTLTNFSNFKITSFPLYWLDETFKQSAFNSNELFNGKITLDTKEFRYVKPNSLFFSHNNRSRPHRCLLVDHLAKYNLLEHGGITWNILTNDKGTFNYWDEKLVKDIEDEAHNTEHFNQYGTPGLGYINSLFDLVSETTPNEIFWTEKTWKPILYGKPFIIWGAKGVNKKLKEYGFHLFEEVVNYDFDDIEDPEERVEALCLELKRLSKLDYKNMDFKEITATNKSIARANLCPYLQTHGDVLNFLQSHGIDPSNELHINLEEQYLKNQKII